MVFTRAAGLQTHKRRVLHARSVLSSWIHDPKGSLQDHRQTGDAVRPTHCRCAIQSGCGGRRTRARKRRTSGTRRGRLSRSAKRVIRWPRTTASPCAIRDPRRPTSTILARRSYARIHRRVQDPANQLPFALFEMVRRCRGSSLAVRPGVRSVLAT